jgi:hypothetical protein
VKSDLSLLKRGDCRLVVRIRTAPGRFRRRSRNENVTADWSCECARHSRDRKTLLDDVCDCILVVRMRTALGLIEAEDVANLRDCILVVRMRTAPVEGGGKEEIRA